MPRHWCYADQLGKFWGLVRVCGPDECWPWTGPARRGYGYHCFRGLDDRSHRIAYRVTYGDIPAGLQVRHKCDNPPCCNPSHLELGTQGDNNADRVARGRNGSAKGVDNGQHRLTENDVAYIRAKRGLMLQRELAAMFGVTQNLVSKVQLRRYWKHL